MKVYNILLLFKLIDEALSFLKFRNITTPLNFKLWEGGHYENFFLRENFYKHFEKIERRKN
jgi:hypothetical protein